MVMMRCNGAKQQIVSGTAERYGATTAAANKNDIKKTVENHYDADTKNQHMRQEQTLQARAARYSQFVTLNRRIPRRLS